jgi:hypothetical protein
MDGRGFRRCDGNPVCGVIKAFEDPGVSLWFVSRMISNDVDTEIKYKEIKYKEKKMQIERGFGTQCNPYQERKK